MSKISDYFTTRAIWEYKVKVLDTFCINFAITNLQLSVWRLQLPAPNFLTDYAAAPMLWQRQRLFKDANNEFRRPSAIESTHECVCVHCRHYVFSGRRDVWILRYLYFLHSRTRGGLV